MGGLGNILAEFVDGMICNSSASETLKPKVKASVKAEVTKIGDITYAICPECKLKYKVTKDENGVTRVLGLTDVDPEEEGLQIFCSRCGTKFTIPEQE